MKNRKEDKVSIILPNYNSHDFISKTIRSVLNQTYHNWELYIVDDASDIRTKKSLLNFKPLNFSRTGTQSSSVAPGYTVLS